MKLTDSDMLTEVVKRGIEGGADLSSLLRYDDATIISWYVGGKVLLIKYSTPSVSAVSLNDGVSLPDLIADHEFMKAVWKGWTCLACNGKKTEKILGFDSSMKNIARVWCNDCNGYVDVINTNTYHALEALKLLHAGENAIKYLYDSLPEESCE